MPSKETVIPLALDDTHAWALAQLCKRLGWAEMRDCSVDQVETYQIRTAVDALAKALAEAGFAPR